MAFELRRDRDLDGEVRRLASDALVEAAGLLRDPDRAGLATSVHEARKRTKMVRGLGRLVAPGVGRDQHRVDRLLRDGSRELSGLRDAHAMLATWDRLARVVPGLDGLGSVREGLAARSEAAVVSADDPRLAEAIALLERARALAGRWDLPDPLGAMRLGLRDRQRRARSALAAVRKQPSDEHLHELRKRMKDLWYHGRLLRPAAPSMLDAYVQTLHDLSDSLGDDHDLAVLVQLVRSTPHQFGGGGAADELEAALAPVRSELQRRSVLVAARVLAEAPKAFGRRLTAYVEVWQHLGDERPVGALDEASTAVVQAPLPGRTR